VWRTIDKTFPVDRVTPNVLRQLVVDLQAAGLGGRSIQHVRRTLHAFFGWCKRRGILLGENPCDGLDWPRARDTMPPHFSTEEFAAHIARVTDPWANALATVAF